MKDSMNKQLEKNLNNLYELAGEISDENPEFENVDKEMSQRLKNAHDQLMDIWEDLKIAITNFLQNHNSNITQREN